MNQASWIDVLHSRKFWALVIALLAIIAGFATQQLTAWEAIQAAVAALAAYSTGVAIEDAGFKAGQGVGAVREPPLPPAQLPPAQQISSQADQVSETATGITSPPSKPAAYQIPPYDPAAAQLTYQPAEDEYRTDQLTHG